MSETGTAVALVQQAEAMNVNLPAIAAERGIDGPLWSALKNSIYRGASDQMILVVTDYCNVRKLDPLKKPVHIVTVKEKNGNGQFVDVETIWEGISSVRTTAMRTGVYAGRDEISYGPDIKESWAGYNNEAINLTFPEWCQVTVYRMVEGVKCAFPGPRVYWLETYASVRGGAPNAMWKKRPRGQLDKCAEAAALRAAFPEELSGNPSAEEMDGQTIDGPAIGPDNAVDITPAETAAPTSGSTLDDFAGTTIDNDSGEAEIPPGLDRRDAETTATTEPEKAAPVVIFVLTDADGVTTDYRRGGAWLNALEKMLTESTSPDAARDVWGANSSAFLDLSAKMAGNKDAVARCEAVSTLAQNLINPPPADDAATAEQGAQDGDLY